MKFLKRTYELSWIRVSFVIVKDEVISYRSWDSIMKKNSLGKYKTTRGKEVVY